MAFVCGAIVGFEREKGHKPAGLRTQILICVGSAVFTVVSMSPAMGAHEPARIAAGAGYVTAAFCLALGVLIVLGSFRKLEALLGGRCGYVNVCIVYRPDKGKTRALIVATLDEAHGPLHFGEEANRPDGLAELHIRHCDRHRDHRHFLAELAAIPGVEAMEQVAPA